MESSEPKRNFFAPVSGAFSDTFLQLRARPLVFLLAWLALSMVPQLVLSYSFQERVSNMMELSYQIVGDTLASGDGDIFITDEMAQIIMKGFRAIIFMLIILSLASIYFGSVLAGIIVRFRERQSPTFTGAFNDGAARFPGFFKAIMVTAVRVIGKPLIISIVGGLAGSLLGQPGLLYFFFLVSSILFLMGVLRYGLAPFIHLSLGIRGREALRIAKAYYISHRPLVSVLFMFVIILPMTLVSLLMNMLIGLNMFSGVGGIFLGVFQSILQLTMTVVIINFAMNNFLPQEWGVGTVTDAPVSPGIENNNT